MIELALSPGDPVPLHPAPVKKFRGTRLPGGGLQVAEKEGYFISIHEYPAPLFSLSLRTIQFNTEQKLHTRELVKGLRLEMVLTGQLHINNLAGQERILLPGQYHITEMSSFQSHYMPGQGCCYFCVHYTPELLTGMRMSNIEEISPRIVPSPMRDLLFRMLENPFEGQVRDFYYENSSRDLLFYHIAVPPLTMPGDLTPTEIAACYAADRIIAENLSIHIPIHELARRTGTNVFVLKHGFPKLFGTGVFERLMQRKMERAKYLLETTDKLVQDVGELSGYETVTGFVTTFRKWYGTSPKDYRKKSRGLM